MSRDKLISLVIENGLKIGEAAGTVETKFAGYEVYMMDNKLYAVVVDDASGWSCPVWVDEIELSELSMFVDDEERAINLYKENFEILK